VDDGEVYGVRLQRSAASQGNMTAGVLRSHDDEQLKLHRINGTDHLKGEARAIHQNTTREKFDVWMFNTCEHEKEYLAEHPKAGDLGSKTGDIIAHHMNLSSNRRTKAETDKARLMKAHRKFGHYDFRKSASIIGMGAPSAEDLPFCRVCAAAKMHRADKSAIKLEPAISTRAGEYLHIDGSGIIRFKTINGNKYFVPVVDDYSGRLFVLLLAKKNHFLEGIRRLISSIETTTGRPVVRMKLDGDGAFRGLDLQKFCDERENVITLQGPPPYTSHKNGKAERAVGVIKEMARCMLIDSGLARKYWGEAVSYAVHVLNRLPRSNTPSGYNCPLSAWRGKDIVNPIAHLHPFGCEAWAIDNREAIKGRSVSLVKQPGTPGIFIGLDARHACYRILSLKYKRVFNTVDVKFDELSFPAVELRHYDADILRDIKRNELLAEDDACDPMVGMREGEDAPGAPPPLREADVEDASDSDEFDEQGDAQQIAQRKSKRDREEHMSDRAREIYLDKVLRQPVAQTGLEATLFKIIAKHTQGDGCVKANFDDLKMRLRSEPDSEPMLALLYSAEQVAMNIPLSLKQADASKERAAWLEARLKHLKLIEEFDTYDLVQLPKGAKAIPTKWVFAAKGKDEDFRKTATEQG